MVISGIIIWCLFKFDLLERGLGESGIWRWENFVGFILLCVSVLVFCVTKPEGRMRSHTFTGGTQKNSEQEPSHALCSFALAS